MKETWIQLDFYQRLLKDSKKGSKVLLDWGTSKGVTWLDRIQDPHSIFCEKRENLSGYEIPHPTKYFVKLNIGGAVCLLDKILLKKRSLDFSMSWFQKTSLIANIANDISSPKKVKLLDKPSF